jgi:hypothetical protein
MTFFVISSTVGLDKRGKVLEEYQQGGIKMSTGYECEFVNIPNEGWYYMLQNWTCPVGCDWYTDATSYGPFKSFEEADKHLYENHANPGGSYTNTQPSAEHIAIVKRNLPKGG